MGYNSVKTKPPDSYDLGGFVISKTYTRMYTSMKL